MTANHQNDLLPSTDHGLIVWQGGLAGAYEIYVYNPATGLTTRLTTNTIADEKPQVQGGRAVWQAPNGSAQNLDVFLWDGTSVRNLTAAGDGASDQKPSIGLGGRIAWQGFDGDPEIDVLNPGGSVMQLTHNRFEEFLPHVDPVTGWVIWHGLDDIRMRVDNPGQGEGGTGATVVGGDFEIFLWNGTRPSASPTATSSTTSIRTSTRQGDLARRRRSTTSKCSSGTEPPRRSSPTTSSMSRTRAPTADARCGRAGTATTWRSSTGTAAGRAAHQQRRQ